MKSRALGVRLSGLRSSASWTTAARSGGIQRLGIALERGERLRDVVVDPGIPALHHGGLVELEGLCVVAAVERGVGLRLELRRGSPGRRPRREGAMRLPERERERDAGKCDGPVAAHGQGSRRHGIPRRGRRSSVPAAPQGESTMDRRRPRGTFAPRGGRWPIQVPPRRGMGGLPARFLAAIARFRKRSGHHGHERGTTGEPPRGAIAMRPPDFVVVRRLP
jgi:hypothetical protein